MIIPLLCNAFACRSNATEWWRQAVTEYSGCRKDQAHVQLFWQALREFTPEERSMLIKFTWGR